MPTPLTLSFEIATPDSAMFPWEANRPPSERLTGFNFRTKIDEGFSDAAGNLARRADRDYPDLALGNSITAVGADGFVAYEGRLEAMPREIGDTHSIGVQFAGWIAHAKDRRFSEIYVDRDLGAWGAMSRGRKIDLMTASFTPYDSEALNDLTDSTAGISTALPGAWAIKPQAEGWYDAGSGLAIGKITGSWKVEGNINTGDVNWEWAVLVVNDDKGSASGGTTGNLRAAGPGSFSLTPSTPYRFGFMYLGYMAAPAGADNTRYGLGWYKLAVYGDHGLPLHVGQPGEPEGVLASDVMVDIATRFCPELNTAGVEPSGYVIQHLAFKDRIFPFEAWQQVNKYHLWHIGVWENRTLTFRPYDLTDYKWEVRQDDPGTTVSLQGPSTEGLFNGIAVTYTDLLTGLKTTLTPLDSADLVDGNENNPWNKQGYYRWDEIELSTPTLAAQALQIGRTALAERNRPKHTGSIKISGYVRDRAGVLQPVWKVRAGDTVTISDHPNDLPRLIHETNYDDDTKSVTLSVEAPAMTLDAVLDRLATAHGILNG